MQSKSEIQHTKTENSCMKSGKHKKTLLNRKCTSEQRLKNLEAENKKLKNDNLLYLMAIKQKIMSVKNKNIETIKKHRTADSTEYIKSIDSLDECDEIDLETSNKLILLVLEKCEEYNNHLKDQLCRALLPNDSSMENFEYIREITDKYYCHLELNECLQRKNLKLHSDNKNLKRHINEYLGDGHEKLCKKRKLIVFTAEQLRMCGSDPTLAHEEYSCKKKLMIQSEKQKTHTMMLINTIMPLKEHICSLLAKIARIRDRLDTFEHGLDKRNEFITEIKNRCVQAHQNSENMENHYQNKMYAETESVKKDYISKLKDKDVHIAELTRVNEDLHDKIQVFSEIIDNLNNNNSNEMQKSE